MLWPWLSIASFWAFALKARKLLGALAAAQLFAAARRAHPGLMDAIGQGDFAPLLGWLRANVHGKGSIATTDEILAEATGAPLSAAAFKAHLESRYLQA